jgi:hypothetical protein
VGADGVGEVVVAHPASSAALMAASVAPQVTNRCLLRRDALDRSPTGGLRCEPAPTRPYGAAGAYTCDGAAQAWRSHGRLAAAARRPKAERAANDLSCAPASLGTLVVVSGGGRGFALRRPHSSNGRICFCDHSVVCSLCRVPPGVRPLVITGTCRPRPSASGAPACAAPAQRECRPAPPLAARRRHASAMDRPHETH